MKKRPKIIAVFSLLTLMLAPVICKSQGIVIQNNGSIACTSASSIEISNGSFVNNGTYTKGGELVTFSGTISGTISGSSNTDIYNLSVTNTGGITTQLDLLTANNITIATGSKFTIDPAKAVIVAGLLTNNNIGGLVLESDATGTGSLITGSNSGSGTCVAKRWMSAGAWHLVSSPVTQTISDFLNSNLSTIATKGTSRGMMDYNATDNLWNSFFTNDKTGNVGAGKGFSARLEGTTPGTNDAAITFTGALQVGSTTVPVTEGKWNCIGNPYTSSIGINTGSSSTENFLSSQGSKLETSYQAIYVWEQPDASNGQSGKYSVYSNASPALDIQQGQAFMLKMAPSKSSIDFNQNMQINQASLPLKSAKDVLPTIKLVASSGSLKSSTVIAFLRGMTTGLDPSYDAGLFKADAELLVYTKLVKDNGVPFAIQALPDDNYNLIIPVGIDSKAGGDVIFSAETTNLSPAYDVILEDVAKSTFTDLSKNSYKVYLNPNSLIDNRFRLYTSAQSVTSANELTQIKKISAYTVRSQGIQINGEVTGSALAYLYDNQGKLILNAKLNEGTENFISTTGFVSGLYILRINNKETVNVFKLVLND